MPVGPCNEAKRRRARRSSRTHRLHSPHSASKNNTAQWTSSAGLVGVKVIGKAAAQTLSSGRNVGAKRKGLGITPRPSDVRTCLQAIRSTHRDLTRLERLGFRQRDAQHAVAELGLDLVDVHGVVVREHEFVGGIG